MRYNRRNLTNVNPHLPYTSQGQSHNLVDVGVSQVIRWRPVCVMFHEAIELNKSIVQAIVHIGPAWDNLHWTRHCCCTTTSSLQQSPTSIAQHYLLLLLLRLRLHHVARGFLHFSVQWVQTKILLFLQSNMNEKLCTITLRNSEATSHRRASAAPDIAAPVSGTGLPVSA